jgi:hypothetical protein
LQGDALTTARRRVSNGSSHEVAICLICLNVTCLEVRVNMSRGLHLEYSRVLDGRVISSLASINCGIRLSIAYIYLSLVSLISRPFENYDPVVLNLKMEL